MEKIEILVKCLTIYHCDRPEPYYAIHFEKLDLNNINPELNNITIYVGFGLSLNMERTVLGFWVKKRATNSYKFWLKVCKQLKDSGVSSIEMKEYNDQYWLTEAMNRVFN